MDWQLFGLTFITVFLAEVGDKSQLAAIALGGSSRAPKLVFLGSVSALILTSLLGVLLGDAVTLVLPTRLLKGLAAIGFMILALRLLWPGEAPEED